MAKLFSLHAKTRARKQTMKRMRLIGATALAAFLLAAGGAQAWITDPNIQSGGQTGDNADPLLIRPDQTRPKPPVVNDGEAYHRADDSEQDPDELRTTRALNDEVAARNQLAENQDRADQEAFELERARYQAFANDALRERLAKARAADCRYVSAMRVSPRCRASRARARSASSLAASR
jgi:hypothetical protein